jgi:hypothetical protein
VLGSVVFFSEVREFGRFFCFEVGRLIGELKGQSPDAVLPFEDYGSVVERTGMADVRAEPGGIAVRRKRDSRFGNFPSSGQSSWLTADHNMDVEKEPTSNSNSSN